MVVGVRQSIIVQSDSRVVDRLLPYTICRRKACPFFDIVLPVPVLSSFPTHYALNVFLCQASRSSGSSKTSPLVT